MKYHKSAVRLFDSKSVKRRGLDLPKEVFWVSAGQRSAELQAVKVGGKKKFYHSAQLEPNLLAPGQAAEFCFKHTTLMAGSSAAL